MKRLLILIVLVLAGCGEVKTVDDSELVKNDGLMYERASGRPFTGVTAFDYLDGHMACRNTYKEGKLDGLQTDWHETTGQKAYEAIYKDGKLVSETKWDEECNEINELPATKQLSTGEIIEQVNASGKITDAQTQSLSKITPFELREIAGTVYRPTKTVFLELNGLTSITDGQAESLSEVRNLVVSQACQPLIDKYKKQ